MLWLEIAVLPESIWRLRPKLAPNGGGDTRGRKPEEKPMESTWGAMRLDGAESDDLRPRSGAGVG